MKKINSKEVSALGLTAGLFLVIYCLPVNNLRFQGSLVEAFRLLKWYACESCPLFAGKAKVVHMGFDDPPALARELAARGADQEKLRNVYRRIRDEIRAFVQTLPEAMERQGGIFD